MFYESSRAQELLRLGTNLSDISFRQGQDEAIKFALNRGARLLLIQRTGWGKSLVYFIATKLLRDKGEGPAILISPLLSLMRNQIGAAQRLGVNAVSINSDNTDDWDKIELSIRRNQIDILLISPERLANDRFQKQVLRRLAHSISLLIIDEAHCISDWGHDFRPHYRLLEKIIWYLPPGIRVIATTATANNRVMDDLRTILGPTLVISRGDLHRPSLKLQTIRLPEPESRLAWLAEQLPKLEGSGIIYTLTVGDAEQVSNWLNSRGIKVSSYTGESGTQRIALENALLRNEVKALVATTALGMGFDKPDLAFVIHYQTPGSVVAYYQQVGRAGRALNSAYGVLLSGSEEKEILDYFIESAFPNQQEVQSVLNALLEARDGLSVPELLSRVNLSQKRILTTLELLALEAPAPIARVKSRWRFTRKQLDESFWLRTQRLTELRRAEQQQMQEYVGLQSGHMNFLVNALDGPTQDCPEVDLPSLPTTPAPAIVAEALTFIRGYSLDIEPRKVWPPGGLRAYNVGGRILPAHRFTGAKALCMWGDASWGEKVRAGKYDQEHFSDALVDACLELIRNWKPQPAPSWVTSIPSSRHPNLVRDFAQRLSTRLELPFIPLLRKVGNRPEQKTMANSSQQARNMDGAFAIDASKVMRGAVFLIDDLIDSRWTITVASWLLRSSGSGPVFPLALALTKKTRTYE